MHSAFRYNQSDGRNAGERDMPLNYLDLQPQIKSHVSRIQALQQDIAAKLPKAIDRLNAMAGQSASWIEAFSNKIQNQPAGARCALPTLEVVNMTADPILLPEMITLLASDGSQIIPSGHDALGMSLINTSRIIYQSHSKQPPQILVQSRLLEDINGSEENRLPSEELITLQRDLSEMEIFTGWNCGTGCRVIAICDGSLELYHQPIQSDAFLAFFQKYLSAMSTIFKNGLLLGGYIDKPRANLVVHMLDQAVLEPDGSSLSGVSDAQLFSRILAPGQRSAVFRLQSSSSHNYQDELALHFFYLNVGRNTKPWIARVEIPGWVACHPPDVDLLHAVFLDQCRLMGSQPYPYLLHRAHEEAVVHFDEKEQLEAMLAQALVSQGVGVGSRSYKLSAKQLQTRTRMK
jgi:hypothetical protein